MCRYNHLHFEWVAPRERRPLGYFEYFVDFRSIPELIVEELGPAGLNRLDDCLGVIMGKGDGLDEAYLLRLLGKEVHSKEIQAIMAQLPSDYSHGLVYDEIWTPIYVSACCADIGCGGLVIKIEKGEGTVTWRFGEPEWMRPLVFEWQEYQNAIEDVRKQIDRRLGNPNWKARQGKL